MKSIELKSFLKLLENEILRNGKVCGIKAFLKDGDGNYHTVNRVDLLRDRIQCDDDYWDCYEWIENSEDRRLFIEENE